MHRLHFLTQFATHPSAANIAILVALGLVMLALAYLASRVTLTVIVAVGMFLELFSGSWAYMGVPVPIDRGVLAFALVVLVLKGARHVSERRVVLRPLHLAILSATAWAAASAIIAGTMFTKLGFYAFLDRFGLVPLTFFCLAPVLFGTMRQRNIFLGLMVAVGLYLSFLGILEGAHLYRFVEPSYIGNPNLGIQWGRARGPMLETTGNGICIYAGAVGAALALATWKGFWARALCVLTIALAFPALFFTLTRSVWIGAFVGSVVALLMVKRTRKWVLPALATAALVVVLGLSVSPKLRTEAFHRTNSELSVWDRQNMYLAAINAVEQHPLTGVGWTRFLDVSANYMVQQSGYPIVGYGLEVHNVFLSRAADLGLPGLFLWMLALFSAARRALLPARLRRRRNSAAPDAWPPQRSPSEEMPEWWRAWRPAGVAIFLCFGVIANLAPFTEPLPNALVWTWLGILAVPYTSRPRFARAVARVPARRREPSPLRRPELVPMPARP